MANVLIVSPHPDDDLIGCGGSIAKHVAKGNLVSIIYVTSGEAGSLKYSKKELANIRKAEATNAVKLIGVDDVYFLNEPDGYLTYSQDTLIKATNIIRKIKPDTVYLPHKSDAHNDHKATHNIFVEAIGRASGPWFQECKGEPWAVKTVLAYEVWTPLQEINYVEDVSEYMDKKIEALGLHKSQIQDIKYDVAVKGLNSYRGIMTGKGKYCECFYIIRIENIV